MRKFQKEQILDIFTSLHMLHRESKDALNKQEYVTVQTALADCQAAAVQMGNAIEQLEGMGTDAVSFLEQYCERLYQISTKLEEVSAQKFYKKLEEILIKAENAVSHIEVKKEIVFFPYKASMWDSLESVYLAAKEDPECDAYCVPVPYYDRNADGSLGHMHYEGNEYPADIEVTHYEDYNLEQRRPDIIYIHNPYDDWNTVTCVHPRYFSQYLKKYTDNLVYIPYFATAGNMSEGQAYCPAYINADYIVIQAEKYRHYYDASIPDEKFLVLGSPKFDSVIRKCKNPPEPPLEWREQIKNRKVYFYNTSIGGMLANTEDFLKKMAYVFETFQGREDACLLWRPHPLLESTFDSMRKEYKPIFEMLKQKFISEKLGIYDTTPDIENSIAISDVYIGDSGTSVTALFGVVGKPIFLLNNKIHRMPQPEEWKHDIIRGMFYNGQNQWYVTQGNKLYYSPRNDYTYEYFCDLSEYAGDNYYRYAVEYKGKVYVCPVNVQHILKVSKDQKQQKIELKQTAEQQRAFYGAVRVGRYLFLLPNKYPVVVRFDMETQEINYCDGVKELYRQVVDGEVRFGVVRVQDDTLFVGSPDGTKVTKINPENMESETIPVELAGGLFVFAVRKNELWGVSYEGTQVIYYDMLTKKREYFDLSVIGTQGNRQIYGTPAIMDNYVIFPPYMGKKFVCLTRDTKEVTEWENDMSKEVQERAAHSELGSPGYFLYPPKGNRYEYFNNIEKKIYDIDILTEETKIIEINFSEEELKAHDAGFAEASEGTKYSCSENAFHSLPDLLDGMLIGSPHSKEKQIEAFSKVNVSEDGNCGQRVHDYMKRK